MDHRELLKKYIRRVRDSEGETFIPYGATNRTDGGAPTVALSAAEVAELEGLEAEGRADEDREVETVR